jgi:nucleotide-binding universal stress UspA family protein
MKTILAPVDFSGVTDAVIAEATALARATEGRVVLLTVIQPPVLAAEYTALMDNIAEIRAAGEKYAEKRLASYEAALLANGVPAETLHLYGSPIPLIVEQATRVEADYIVMGSHGHTALYDLFVGSTTHGVLLRAACPVLIVPIRQKKPAKPRKERHAVA